MVDALLLELDQRVERFVERRGEPSLIGALEAWVHRTEGPATLADTSDFQNAERFETLVADLAARHKSAGRGLRKLDHVLYCMGVLAGRLVPPRLEQDPRPALPAMLDVVWPMTLEEQTQRAELAILTGEETWRATWELYTVRIFGFWYALWSVFKDDEAAGRRLGDRLDQLLQERAHGEEAPANLEQFLTHRSKEYSRLGTPGNPAWTLSPTAFVGETFAWYCRRTLDHRVRLIGAREFAIAHARLKPMIEAYRRSGPV